MLIATLPPPHRYQQMKLVAQHPLVDGVRFNVGARVPYTPKETLERILDVTGNKKFWVDLKGRQLRITLWAIPTYGDIVLNHPIEVDVPAVIYFRGDEKSTITEVRGNKIYVDPPPRYAVGDGQAINIHGSNLKIKGFLTEEDKAYIEAAKELDIHDYALSFVEEEQDIKDVIALDPKAKIVAKIESPKGLKFVENIYPKFSSGIRLMSARDDLFINIGDNKVKIFDALKLIIEKDPNAIAASRILTSLEKSDVVSMGDLSDLRLMELMGYRSFLLSDGLCSNEKAFMNAMAVYEQYRRHFGN